MKCMSAMRRESGLSLVTAVFLLLVLAGLGLFITSISSVQTMTSAFDLQGSRAYHAARAGIEFGAYQSIVADACPATVNVVLPAGRFADFASVTVLCNRTVHTEGVTAKNHYRITANACNQPAAAACPNPAPGANYVERELQISVINPP